MSFKLSNVARFFSRTFSNVQNEKKNSAPQLSTLNFRKNEKNDSTKKESKIVQFFNTIFGSREKARQGVEKALQNSNAPHPSDVHVKKTAVAVVAQEAAKLSIEAIISNTPAPDYLKMYPASSSGLNEGNRKDDEISYSGPKDFYAELDKRRNFLESEAGFMITITHMGSCVENPQKYFRTLHPLDLQKTLTVAFQIYYEEGKKNHEDSFAMPNWEPQQTALSAEGLKGLTTDMKKISAFRADEQTLLQKTIDAIEGRIVQIYGQPQNTARQ